MNQKKNVQWDAIGKIVIIVLALGLGFFFPFQKYLNPFAKNSVAEKKDSKPDMMAAVLEEKNDVQRDYNANPEVYWRRNGNGYLLYVNGRQLAGTQSSWSGDDLLVHDPRTEVTYILNNFKNLKDNQLREAEIQGKN